MKNSNQSCFLVLPIACLLMWSSLMTGCDTRSSPSNDTAKAAWEKYLAEHKGCLEHVKFTNFKVIGTYTKDNEAEILIEVTGDWIGDWDAAFRGPCVGFDANKGKNQAVEKVMAFKKYGDSWRLVDVLNR